MTSQIAKLFIDTKLLRLTPAVTPEPQNTDCQYPKLIKNKSSVHHILVWGVEGKCSEMYA